MGAWLVFGRERLTIRIFADRNRWDTLFLAHQSASIPNNRKFLLLARGGSPWNLERPWLNQMVIRAGILNIIGVIRLLLALSVRTCAVGSRCQLGLVKKVGLLVWSFLPGRQARALLSPKWRQAAKRFICFEDLMNFLSVAGALLNRPKHRWQSAVPLRRRLITTNLLKKFLTNFSIFKQFTLVNGSLIHIV